MKKHEVPLWTKVYKVDEKELQRDLCNLFFDEDSERYKTPCKCSRCEPKIQVKSLFGGLR